MSDQAIQQIFYNRIEAKLEAERVAKEKKKAAETKKQEKLDAQRNAEAQRAATQVNQQVTPIQVPMPPRRR